jgi:hypothetical protein
MAAMKATPTAITAALLAAAAFHPRSWKVYVPVICASDAITMIPATICPQPASQAT